MLITILQSKKAKRFQHIFMCLMTNYQKLSMAFGGSSMDSLRKQMPSSFTKIWYSLHVTYDALLMYVEFVFLLSYFEANHMFCRVGVMSSFLMLWKGMTLLKCAFPYSSHWLCLHWSCLHQCSGTPKTSTDPLWLEYVTYFVIISTNIYVL